jgi:hypothetical protein
MPVMRIISTHGVIAAEVDQPQDRTILGRHANAVGRFLATGDTDGLIEFVDTVVADHRPETDPDELEAWAAQGELEWEDIYNETGR